MSQGEQQAMGANKRTVWTIATQPSPLPHFATFPEALVKPCILAGSPETCCAECGAPPLPAKGTCGQCGSDLIRGPLAPVPGRVLDIFAGTGTVGVVSQKAGRSATLIELSPEYVEIMERRLAQRALL
jgi:DNA modification methylase